MARNPSMSSEMDPAATLSEWASKNTFRPFDMPASGLGSCSSSHQEG